MWRWLLFALCILPNVGWGAEGPLFHVESTDKSMEYLGIILGHVPGSPIAVEANPLIGSLFYAFNHLIFSLGIIIVSYATIVGTLNTAQEGEFFGKQKWHPIMVPLRAAVGIYLLLPLQHGFNGIQVAVIWLIVQGVGAANALWTQVIYYTETKNSEYSSTQEIKLHQIGNTINAIYNANICMNALNNNHDASTLLGEKITVYRWQNRIEWGRQSRAGEEAPLCGSIKIPNLESNILYHSNITDFGNRQDQLASGVFSAQQILMLPADMALSNHADITSGSAAFVSAAEALLNAAKGLAVNAEGFSKINQEAIKQGWIHAGSYYFQVVQAVGNGTSLYFSHTDLDANGIYTLLGKSLGGRLLESSQKPATHYAKNCAQQIQNSHQHPQFTMTDPSSGLHTGSFFTGLFGDMMTSLVRYLSEEITTGSANADPLLSMAAFGAWITTAAEGIFWVFFTTYIVTWIGSALTSAVFGFGFGKLNFLFGFFIVISFLFISVLYLAGCILALYVPLIPYLVFTFAGFSWIILVIEALLGASLIGLSFIVPSEDEIGKAGHAMVILLGLFLRPALMIVGFIFSMQLLNIAAKMLNFGFWEALLSSTGGANTLGVFGMLVVLIVYTGIVITLAHEAFSLIYILPNKVLRWISGTADEEIAGQKTKELKGYFQKGGSFVKGTISGVTGEIGKRVQQNL